MAVNLAIAEHGDISTWDWKNSYTEEEMDNFVKSHFLPHLNVIKYCSAKGAVRGCFPKEVYMRITGNTWTTLDDAVRPKVVLADGAAIQFGFDDNCLSQGNRCLSLRVDVNGVKKPNLYGADAHIFSFYPQTNEFLPMGVYKDKSYNEETKTFERVNIIDSCDDNGTCAARIVQNGFKIDYDW